MAKLLIDYCSVTFPRIECWSLAFVKKWCGYGMAICGLIMGDFDFAYLLCVHYALIFWKEFV
jgi:hypothetical protein